MNFTKEKVEKALGFKIKDENLFRTAFTHRSYLNEHLNYKNPSNERLEFLGDAVLQLVSSEYLYNKFPESKEGVLTNYRAALVCTPSLAAEAKRLSYGEFLLLSVGEEASGGRDREYILANTFEAVLGAIYLEGGLDVCKTFVETNLLHKIDDIVANREYKDAKSTFQEEAQEKFGVTPAYRVLNTWGADHEKKFSIGVYINNGLYGKGEGNSKQKAEQEAALAALDKIKNV